MYRTPAQRAVDLPPAGGVRASRTADGPTAPLTRRGAP